MKRVIFYFDGFNFYHGLKDKSVKMPAWKNYYRIDLVKFTEHFFDDKSIVTAYRKITR